MRGRRQFTAIASRYRDISRSVCRAPDSLAVQDRWLSRVSPMPQLGPGIGLTGNHVYPAACFASAGRLIAHVVHHIRIVSEGLPLLTSRMHANPASNIYCSCADRVDATQLRRSLVLTRRNTHQQNHFRLIVIETPGCGRLYARSPASRQASRTRPARRWLQLPERCSSNWREFSNPNLPSSEHLSSRMTHGANRITVKAQG
jgi:hypothetical protein